jgi:hypothetical protein
VSALLKLPIEQCRDIGRGTLSSVLAARQSARWSSARRVLAGVIQNHPNRSGSDLA